MIVKGGQPFNFNYTAYDQASGLKVAGIVYDVTSGTPVLVGAPIAMVDAGQGAYAASFTPVAGKSYLIISACYLDSGFTEVDTTRAPNADNFDAFVTNNARLNFNYGAYDFDTTLDVTATIYDITSNLSYTASMAYVALGVYFGFYQGIVGKSYLVVEAPSDPARSPNSDSFQTITFNQPSVDPGVANVLQGVNYVINGVPLTGTYNQNAIPTLNTHLLAEAAVGLIIDTIRANIATALANVRGYWEDGKVTTEIPPSESYFVYPKAWGYRCPAIFVIDEGMDFRQSLGSNFINAVSSINVSVKVEDKDQYKLAIKAWRYLSAIHTILEQANLASSDNAVKLVVKVTRVKASPMYTIDNDDPEDTAQFFKEYELMCEVEFYENL